MSEAEWNSPAANTPAERGPSGPARMAKRMSDE